MSRWFSLVRKDFRLGRRLLIMPIIAIIIVIGMSEYGKYVSGQSGILLGSTLVILVLHMFYIMIYIFRSLRMEARTLHLWLHSPLSGYMLLGSKLLSSVLSLLISIALTIIVLVYAMNYDVNIFQVTPLTISDMLHLGSLVILQIILMSIYFGVWVIFYWTFYRILKTRIGSGFSIISTIVLYIILSKLFDMIRQTNVYLSLTQWGTIHIQLPSIIDMTLQSMRTMMSTGLSIHIGTTLFYMILSIGIFIVSGWLLDNKVEV